MRQEARALLKELFLDPLLAAIDDENTDISDVAGAMIGFFSITRHEDNPALIEELQRLVLSADQPEIVRGIGALILARHPMVPGWPEDFGLFHRSPVAATMLLLGLAVRGDVANGPDDPRVDVGFWESLLYHGNMESLIAADWNPDPDFPTLLEYDTFMRLSALRLNGIRLLDGRLRGEALRVLALRGPEMFRLVLMDMIYGYASDVRAEDSEALRSMMFDPGEGYGMRVVATKHAMRILDPPEAASWFEQLWEDDSVSELRQSLLREWTRLDRPRVARSDGFWNVTDRYLRSLAAEGTAADYALMASVLAQEVQKLASDEQFVPWFESTFLGDPRPETRVKALSWLDVSPQFWSPQGIEMLARALEDADLRVRLTAARKMAHVLARVELHVAEPYLPTLRRHERELRAVHDSGVIVMEWQRETINMISRYLGAMERGRRPDLR